MNTFDFNGLIIFEMSKNHGGNVEHGIHTVHQFAEVAKQKGVRAAVKLQFWDLNSYIHTQHKERGDERMKRYYSSHLHEWEFKMIVDEIKANGLISITTPFDEASVDAIDRLGIEVIKVASASASDWPLLSRMVQSKKPVVCSTGGLKIQEIDALVEFFKKHNTTFALLHCVGLYPTPKEEMQLNRIEFMRKRYLDVPIGFSTHEDPNDISCVQMAYAKGARLFEKHIIVLNEWLEDDPSFQKVLKYTATTKQAADWLDAYKEAIVASGTDGNFSFEPSEKELNSLRSMKRGVYAASFIKKGGNLTREKVYFAIPLEEGKMDSGSWKADLVAGCDYLKDDAISLT